MFVAYTSEQNICFIGIAQESILKVNLQCHVFSWWILMLHKEMPGSYLTVLDLHMNNLHSEVEYIVYVLSVCNRCP